MNNNNNLKVLNSFPNNITKFFRDKINFGKQLSSGTEGIIYEMNDDNKVFKITNYSENEMKIIEYINKK